MHHKRVWGVVDGGGMYFSRLAAAGGWVFFGSTAVDLSGELAAEARVGAPYHLSPSAQVRAQTRYIFTCISQGLKELGSSVDDICKVEQYIQFKSHADGYLETSRGPGFMEKKRPTSALLEAGDFVPESCVVCPSGIAVVPDESRKKEVVTTDAPGPAFLYGEEPPYSDVVAVGPYFFSSAWPCDYATGIQPAARVAQWVWWGNEARSEALWNVYQEIRPRVEYMGATLDDVVHCTIYLTDIADLFEVDLVWREAFPTNPPARTVVPVRGLGIPRWEAPRGHRDGAIRMEVAFEAIRKEQGAEKAVVRAGVPQLGHQSEAVRAGSLLWVSAQMAGIEEGVGGDAAGQLRVIFSRIAEICRAGGTDLSNLLRVRAYVTDPATSYGVYAALREHAPSDPPTACVVAVPEPLALPGAAVMVDAVAYVPA